MGWNKESIAAKRRELALVKYKDLTQAELIEQIIKLETTLYPFAYVLGSIGEKSWRGTHATSMLFPDLNEKDEFQFYVGKDKGGDDYGFIYKKDVAEECLHEDEYLLTDSVVIDDGTKLNDDFVIIAVHQQGPGAYISCGDITMAEVRDARRDVFGEPKIKEPES